jgi:hypothetical protein
MGGQQYPNNIGSDLCGATSRILFGFRQIDCRDSHDMDPLRKSLFPSAVHNQRVVATMTASEKNFLKDDAMSTS